MEKRYIRKDGSIVWIDLTVSVVRKPSGEPNYIVGVIEDISERKQAEEALREAHRRTEDILESITDAFYTVDRQWRFPYINERALHYMQAFKNDTELTREEPLGKNVWEVFPEAVSTVFYDSYHEAMSEQKVVDLEEYYSPNDVWLEVHVYPSEEGLSFYWRDITERKRTEEWVEEGRDAERSRIARDLHDEPLQELTDAVVQAQQIRSLSEDLQQTLRLVRLLATLDRIGPQLRGAIYDLRLE
jgi:PAS domain S-box-containing protein